MNVIPKLALVVGEDQPKLALRARQAPLLQRVHNEQSQRDRSLARFSFGFADLAEAVGALAHMKLALLEIHGFRGRPRNSELRIPVKMAVTRIGLARPFAAWTLRLIWSGVGMSIPTFSFALSRLLSLIDTSIATFWATLPRRLASRKSDLRLVSTFARLRA